MIGDEVRRERPGRRPLTRRTSSAVKGSVINFAISGGSRAAEMKVVLWVLLSQVEDECSGAKRPGTGGSRLKFWKKKIGVLNVPGGRLVDGSQCWCWGWLFWKKEHYMCEERCWSTVPSERRKVYVATSEEKFWPEWKMRSIMRGLWTLRAEARKEPSLPLTLSSCLLLWWGDNFFFWWTIFFIIEWSIYWLLLLSRFTDTFWFQGCFY